MKRSHLSGSEEQKRRKEKETAALKNYNPCSLSLGIARGPRGANICPIFKNQNLKVTNN